MISSFEKKSGIILDPPRPANLAAQIIIIVVKGLGEVRILTPRGGVGWLVGGLIRKY